MLTSCGNSEQCTEIIFSPKTVSDECI